MGTNTNVDASALLNANVANTTRNSNLSPGGPVVPNVLQEGPEDGELEALEYEEGFDPSNHTVAEVKEYVTSHPDQRDSVLADEKDGKNRVTLVDWLSAA